MIGGVTFHCDESLFDKYHQFDDNDLSTQFVDNAEAIYVWVCLYGYCMGTSMGLYSFFVNQNQKH
jgi:hypothetical protein